MAGFKDILRFVLRWPSSAPVGDSTVSPVDVATVWTMRPANRLASVSVGGRLATAQPAIRLGTVER